MFQAKYALVDLSFELRLSFESLKYQGERASESSPREEKEEEEKNKKTEEKEKEKMLDRRRRAEAVRGTPLLSYVWSCMSTCKSTKRSTSFPLPCCCA